MQLYEGPADLVQLKLLPEELQKVAETLQAGGKAKAATAPGHRLQEQSIAPSNRQASQSWLSIGTAWADQQKLGTSEILGWAAGA